MSYQERRRRSRGVVRALLLTLGILGVLAGLIWIGQGTGYFPYPRSSFMISQMSWAYRGAATAIVGLILIFASRRI
jgi:hypothetical protein